MTAAEVTSMARRIMASSIHMHAFISDLLGYTLAHDQPLRNEAVDLSALCRTVAELRTLGKDEPGTHVGAPTQRTRPRAHKPRRVRGHPVSEPSWLSPSPA